MKSGLYITNWDIDKKEIAESGIGHKILSQAEVIKNLDDVKLEFKVAFEGTNNIFIKLWRRLPFTPSLINWNTVQIEKDVDFIYIRKVFFDFNFLHFLKRIKKEKPSIIILLEIPTYPYDLEFEKFLDLPLLWKEKWSRKYLHRYVDRIVTLSKDEMIFDTKTIQIINGVDVSRIVPILPAEDDTVDLIGVAALKMWHGFERLIRGIGNYYATGGKRKVLFHVVGEGDTLASYKQLVAEQKLEEYVVFYGTKSGKDLDIVYNQADVAICSLGCHRKKVYLSSELKSREYLGKGLPIISSSKIDVLAEDFPFCLRVPEDETDIELKSILDFYDNVYGDKSHNNVMMGIRDFAKKNCDMSVTMKPVADYLYYRFDKHEN